MKAYVYFAAIWLPVSAGCAYGKITEDNFPEDGGILHADGGTKDAKAPTQDAQAVQDSAQQLPETSTTTQCDPLPLGTGLAQCDTCLGSDCCAEDQACGDDQDCMGFIECVNECLPTDGGPPDQQCESDCETTYPNGANELSNLDSCMESLCTTECQ